MRRSVSLCLLSVSLGMPAVIAETCHVDFKEVWARKVAAIQAWNKSHASYVARHHLDRDMSANTRRMRERARRSLEVMCNIPVLDAEPNLGGLLDIPSEAKATPTMEGRTGNANVPTGTNELTALIAQEEYPTYDNPNVAYEGSAGGLGYWPWGYPTYFPIVQSGGTRTPSFPVGPTIPNPVGPIAATPESGTFVLSAVPMLALCLLGRKKKGDL